MSNALAVIHFPDGELRVGFYFGSADVVVPILYPIDDVLVMWERGIESVMDELAGLDAPEPSDAEDVGIWTSYGGGRWWNGRASKAASFITSGADPYGVMAEFGQPDAEEPREVHDGTPDWVPEELTGLAP